MEDPEAAFTSSAKEENSVFSSRGRLVLFLALITLLCLVEILLFWYFHQEQNRDAVLYIHLIKVCHENGPLRIVEANFLLPPLYFYLSHLLMCLGLSAESAGLFVSMTCGAALPLVVYGIAFEILQRKDIALGAALLTAVNPNVIELSCSVLRDIPYLLFAGIVLYFFLAGVRREKWFLQLLAGVFCAPSLLLRYETVEFIPLVLLYALIALLRKREKWYRLLRDTVIFFAGLAATLVMLLCWMGGSSDMKMVKMYRDFFKRQHSLLSMRHMSGQALPLEFSPTADDNAVQKKK